MSKDSGQQAVAAFARKVLAETSPDFDLASLAQFAQSKGVFTPAEADHAKMYGDLPEWLAEEVSLGKAGHRPLDETELLPGQRVELGPPVASSVQGDLTQSFKQSTLNARPIQSFRGGKTRHYVKNFQKMCWDSEGIYPDLCDKNGLPFLRYLENTAPVELPGHTFLGVVEGSVVYTHWLLDTLPRLLILLDQGQDLSEFDHFLFATTAHKFHKGTLSALGIAADKVVTRQQHGPLFALDSFTHVTQPRTQFANHTRIFEMVCSFFGHGKTSSDQGRRFFVSRAGAGRRRIVNEEEILERLRPLGFEPIRLEDYEISETAALLAQASHIISPHGAGLANLIFADTGTKVMELFNAHLSREYWMICQQKGLEYHAFETHGPDGAYVSAQARQSLSFLDRNGLDLLVPEEDFMNYVEGVFLK